MVKNYFVAFQRCKLQTHMNYHYKVKIKQSLIMYSLYISHRIKRSKYQGSTTLPSLIPTGKARGIRTKARQRRASRATSSAPRLRLHLPPSTLSTPFPSCLQLSPLRATDPVALPRDP